MRTFTAMMVAFFLSAVPLAGQVDRRVNVGNPAGGYAKDANPMVGSGGLNLTRPGMFDAGAYSNAIVTGNVTGLAGFRGFSPILGQNEFRDSLPSAGLSSFYARTVGANDATTNAVPRSGFFMGRSETVTDAGLVRQGFDLAGAYGSSSQNVASTVQQRPVAGGRLNLVPDPTDVRSQGPESVETQAVRQREMGRPMGTAMSSASAGRPGALGSPGTTYESAFREAVSSPIFGAPPRGSRVRATLNLLEPPQPRDVLAELGLASAASGGEGSSGSQDSAGPRSLAGGAIVSRIEGDGGLGMELAGGGRAGAIGDVQPRGVSQRDIGAGVSDSSGLPASRMPPTAAKYDGAAPVNLGADRFADLYNAVRTAQQLGVRQLGFVDSEQTTTGIMQSESGAIGTGAIGTGGMAVRPPDGTGPAGATEKEAAKPGDAAAELLETAARARRTTNMLRRSASDSLQELAARAKWASDALEDPIVSFAGHHEGELNRIIVEAERLMMYGEFYRAADQFDLACLIDPRNPLPLLGRGHAWVAAGDYASGLASILAGIDRFPQIAAFRLDLPALVGQRDVFDRRRADLTKRLERREDHELRFLLGYLELYSGLSVEGLRDIELAAKAAPADSTIAKFYDSLVDRGPLLPLPE